jgi:hypothetical protein
MTARDVRKFERGTMDPDHYADAFDRARASQSPVLRKLGHPIELRGEQSERPPEPLGDDDSQNDRPVDEQGEMDSP